jgi:hypothetical protein
VLCRKGNAIPLTSDHKPDRIDEAVSHTLSLVCIQQEYKRTEACHTAAADSAPQLPSSGSQHSHVGTTARETQAILCRVYHPFLWCTSKQSAANMRCEGLVHGKHDL